MKFRTHLALTAPGIHHLYLAQRGLWLFTVLCLALSVGIWWYGNILNEESLATEQQTQEVREFNARLTAQAAAEGIDVSVSRLQALPAEVAFAKKVRHQLGFSWTKFLNDLESAVPKHVVSMETVKFNFKDASIALSGSAKTLTDMNQLVDGLEAHSAFHDVELAKHSTKRLKKTDPHTVVAFTMTVKYGSFQQTPVTGPARKTRVS